jgi:hypothetical protein
MESITAIGAAAGAVTLIGVVWKWLIRPNLDREYVPRRDCMLNHQNVKCENDRQNQALETLRGDVGQIRDEVHTTAVHVEWIRATLERDR